VQEVAGYELYQGATGIALFVAELGARIGDSQFQRVAEGALRHAEHSLASARPSYSFHSGVCGLAYVFGRCAQLFGQEVFAERALTLLKPLRGIEYEMPGTDVIAGPAGAIPVFLLLAEPLEEPALEECAIHLGLHLIRTDVSGRWDRRGCPWARLLSDLNGLAHGAAGVGAALSNSTESQASGIPFAAEQAFAYEQESFDATLANWPDFRNAALSEAISNVDRREALKAAMSRGGEPPHYKLHFMNAWCHGAAGIGLTRLRAYELLGNLTYRAEAEQAVEATARHASIVHNYSLCHGMFGNDETLILGSRILGNPSWEQSAVHRALESIEQYEFSGAGWPSGTIGASPDPSLMLGDAGIGYYLLRLAHTDTPSIVLPVVQRNQPRSTAITSRTRIPERLAVWGAGISGAYKKHVACARIADKVGKPSRASTRSTFVGTSTDAALRAEPEHP
jgi:lantibiotic modifying enzyme